MTDQGGCCTCFRSDMLTLSCVYLYMAPKSCREKSKKKRKVKGIIRKPHEAPLHARAQKHMTRPGGGARANTQTTGSQRAASFIAPAAFSRLTSASSLSSPVSFFSHSAFCSDDMCRNSLSLTLSISWHQWEKQSIWLRSATERPWPHIYTVRGALPCFSYAADNCTHRFPLCISPLQPDIPGMSRSHFSPPSSFLLVHGWVLSLRPSIQNTAKPQ